MFNFRSLLKNRKTLLLALPIFFLFIILISSSSQNSNNQTVSPESKITPSADSLQVQAMTLEKQMEEQTKDDAYFRNWEKSIYNNYPWYDSLPLQTKEFYVYFDIDKKVFYGSLYPVTSNKNRLISQVVLLKSTVRKSLSDLGIDVKQYSFEWNIVPESGELDELPVDKFEKTIMDPEKQIKISDYTESYGTPPWVFKGSEHYGSQAQTYIYPDLGIAFIANPQTNEVLEQHIFDPMKVEEYVSKYGEDIPAQP